MKKRLVTSALPYANGQIHLGHLVEYIQTDIWVRFQRLLGRETVYVCADDTHGTPIMLSAKKQGISEEKLLEKVSRDHQRDFAGFHIQFDNYYSTNSPENKARSEEIYHKAKAAGVIYEKDIDQYYCDHDDMFLPDRFIRGECPACHSKDQYGDACEICARTYAPTDLINPHCAECGNTPTMKSSKHHFFKLSALEDTLKNWINGNHLKKDIKNKLREWFEAGLKDWDISRDAPYFGFKIPGTDNKYFYVWMDAPVGYMAATENWAKQQGKSFDDYWKNPNTEIHHFIGKDIMYFHTLFWPAMLHVSGYNLPHKINVHGFLTVNGEKMSKSRGTFIEASHYLKHLDPNFLRYYYAAKLAGSTEDIDLNPEDFVNRVNADLLGKAINIASRTAAIVNKKLDGKLGSIAAPEGKELLEKLRAQKNIIADHYESLAFNKAMRDTMALADEVNKYINDKAPWAVVKENETEAREVCTVALNALRVLMTYLKPVVPTIAAGVETFLACEELNWERLNITLENHAINPYQHLASRLTLDDAKQLLR